MVNRKRLGNHCKIRHLQKEQKKLSYKWKHQEPEERCCACFARLALFRTQLIDVQVGNHVSCVAVQPETEMYTL